jgi:hypothetical protein
MPNDVLVMSADDELSGTCLGASIHLLKALNVCTGLLARRA